MDEKKTKLLKVLIPVGIVVILIAVIGITALVMHGDRTGTSDAGQTVVVNISEEDNIDSIADKLKKDGVISLSWYFKLYCNALRGSTINRGFNIGDVDVGTSMSYDKIIESIVTPWYTERATIQLTFPEGSEVSDIVTKLVNNGIGTRDGFADVIANYDFGYDFIPAAGSENRLEGFLYPDTYIFYADSTEVEALTKFLDAFISKIVSDSEIEALMEETDYSFYEVIILASIVEKETGSFSDMPDIASVFLNRINKKMLLQSCATYNYTVPKADRSSALASAQMKDDSPYNTYLYKGLPPTPIANPGRGAVLAVLNPSGADYLYFCATGDGGTAFASTLAEHEANVAKYKANW